MWRCKQCGKWFNAEGEVHVCEPEVLVCWECGEKFVQTGPKTCYCSEECRELGENRKNRERQRLYRERQRALEVQRAYRERQWDNAAARKGMPDPYDGKLLYFDGLHPFRGSMAGRAPDPVLGF